uniref:Uncharacterized protein n=1 Tax=Globodera pallida TaxID=36090 RepID=A0A183CI68_GLOPA
MVGIKLTSTDVKNSRLDRNKKLIYQNVRKLLSESIFVHRLIILKAVCFIMMGSAGTVTALASTIAAADSPSTNGPNLATTSEKLLLGGELIAVPSALLADKNIFCSVLSPTTFCEEVYERAGISFQAERNFSRITEQMAKQKQHQQQMNTIQTMPPN